MVISHTEISCFLIWSSWQLCTRLAICMRILLPQSDKGFTAFSLPGQFAPGSESANKTLANSLPGTFVPWPIRSLALSLLGLLTPWNFRSPERNGPGTFRSLELSHPGVFASRNIRSLELLFPVSPRHYLWHWMYGILMILTFMWYM